LTLADLEPVNFLSVRNFSGWLVVNSTPATIVTTGLMPEEIRVPYSREGEQQFVKAIQALMAKRGSFTRLLVLNEEGGGYDQVNRALSGLDGCGLFYLAGGQKALEGQLNMMAAMKNSRKESTRTLAAAGSGTRVIRKPCESCP
jgi:hypothetical protein